MLCRDPKDVLTISVHRHPTLAHSYFTGFPDERGAVKGRGFHHKLALDKNLGGAAYRRVLKRALAKVGCFEPQFVAVCLGLDIAKGDPTGTWLLRARDFEDNGKLIGQLDVPTLAVQEGGYNARNLGVHARFFFEGPWKGAVAHA